MDHLPMIMIASGYNRARKSFMEKSDQGECVSTYLCENPMNRSMEKSDRGEWVSKYLCENPSRSSPKESAPDISVLIVILYVIIVLELSTQTVSTAALSDVSGYDYSLEIISSQIHNKQRCLSVCHWVTVTVLMELLCVWNVGEIFYARWKRQLLCEISWFFL